MIKKVLAFLSKVCLLGVILTVSSFGQFASAANNKWKQDQFVISTFQGVSDASRGFFVQVMSTLKEANLTHVETAFTSPSTSEQTCMIAEQVGLKVIVMNYEMFGGFQNVYVPAKTEQEIRASAEAAMQLYGKYKSLEGFYIWDEPYHTQFPLVRKVLDIFAEKFPDKLLFLGSQQSGSGGDIPYRLNPRPGTNEFSFTEYIDRWAQEVNPPLFVSNKAFFYDGVDKGLPLGQSEIWDNYGYLRNWALKKNVPMWYYVQLVGDPIQNQLGNNTIERVRMTVNSLLSYGVKGINYYTTYNTIVDYNGRKIGIFDDVKQLNAETLKVGNEMLKFKSQLVYHTGDVNNHYDNKITDSKIVRSATDELIIGEFKSEKNQDYLYITARTYDRAYEGRVNLKNNYRVDVFNKSTGKYELIGMNVGSINLNYAAGGGNLYRILPKNTDVKEEPTTSAKSTSPSSSKSSDGTTSNISATSQQITSGDSTAFSDPVSTDSVSSKTRSSENANEKPQSPGLLGWIIGGVTILLAGGCTGFLFFLRKKKVTRND
ncbi:MAG: hypothetical protein GX136_00660 [Clostridiales bacterium]|nr:hypothetical protein [Clostridiales bacterium]